MQENKKKVLFVANHKGFSKFNAPYMKWFQEQGWQVDNASPGIMVDCVDNHYDIPIQRSPLSSKNITAYRELKKLIDANDYDIIHVHTPMGAFLGRLAARAARKRGSKVIYTAHGFHFFAGASKKNWLIYYPIERLMSGIMDALVTINQEDYERAKRMNLAKGNIYKIDGVGVNLDRFKPLDDVRKSEIRRSLGINENDFVMLYTSQIIPRKNHRWIINLLPELKNRIPNLKVIFLGGGSDMEACQNLVNELGLSDSVLFLGFREDVPDICGISDIHVSSSLQEGLAINNIEAMAMGCPLVISNVRGHKDVCVDGRNGFLYNLSNPDKFIESVVKLSNDKSLYMQIRENNLKDVEKFSVKREVAEMAKIYKTLM